jgi:hypothetical protein
MPFSFPATLPSSFRTVRLTWTARRASSVNESPFTFTRQRYHHPGERWEVNAVIPPLGRADAETLVAWLLAVGRGTIWLRDTSYPGRRGAVTGTLTVGSGATANAATLPISGATGSFATGDLLQIGGTLHKVIHVDSSSSVQVFPRLRAAHTAGTAIEYAAPRGLFHLSEPTTSWEIDTGRNYGLTVGFIDAVGASTTSSSLS